MSRTTSKCGVGIQAAASGGSGGGTVRKTVSTTGPECGVFAKGGHERQSACEAHTACDRHGRILGVEVTAGNVNGSTAWDAVYNQVTGRFPEAAFSSSWTRAAKHLGSPKRPWRTTVFPSFHTRAARAGKTAFVPGTSRMTGFRIVLYVRKAKRSAIPPPAKMENECIAVPQAMPMQSLQAALRRGRRLLTTHIGQEHLGLAEQLRKTRRGKEMYSSDFLLLLACAEKPAPPLGRCRLFPISWLRRPPQEAACVLGSCSGF